MKTNQWDNLNSMNKFGEWILCELEKRDLTQADLARLAGASRTAISNIVSGERPVGKKLAEKIADALRVPLARVYQEAGLLPPDKTKRDQLEEELLHNFNLLDEEAKSHVATIVRALVDVNKKKTKP